MNKKILYLVVGIMGIITAIVSIKEEKPIAVAIIYGVASFIFFMMSLYHLLKEKNRKKESIFKRNPIKWN